MAKFGFWRREDMLSIRKILMLVLVLVAPLANAAYESSGSIFYNVNNSDLSIYQESINASQGDEITLEVTADNFDPFMMVFLDGVLMSSAFDADMDMISTLTFDATVAGEYLVTIGQYLYDEAEALGGVQHGAFFLAGDEGTFVLSVSGVTEVPVPAALPMFLSALFGLGFLRRKR
jgi:transcriptional regulator GlxA family with amidase domain